MRRLARMCVLVLSLLVFASPLNAAPVDFFATLSGAAEIPPVASSGSGSAEVILDLAAHTLEVQATFSGLSTPDTMAHIHCCIAQPANTGVATTVPSFPGFPLGVTSGTYDMVLSTLDLGTYNPAFVTANGGTAAGAEAALSTGLLLGQTYFNIHTSQFPGGEIRGILHTPEPGTLLLLGAGVTGLALRLSRKRRVR